MNRRDVLANAAAAVASIGLARTASGETAPLAIVPPETASHAGTFMQWPVDRRVHPDRAFLEVLQKTIARIANTIVAFEPVIMLAASAHHTDVRAQLSDKVELWNIPTEDLWCRDSGPLFAKLSNGSRVISHLQFNGWGHKQVHKRDGQIARLVAERLGIPLVPSGLVGEAGGVEHDGHGLLMAHESCWVNENRNPGLDRAEIEQRLLTAYGARRMIWSPGLRGEDITDYHIDSLARFTGPGRVLMNLPRKPDARDPFHRAALETRDRVIAAGMELTTIFEPDRPRVRHPDFVASYVNYYVCNRAVIVAQFGETESDARAQSALRAHYPGRQVIALNVDALGEVGGGIHCATQPMPA
ncbi:MAG: agmatine deiminase family protein [Pseudomonadota bacterium]